MRLQRTDIQNNCQCFLCHEPIESGQRRFAGTVSLESDSHLTFAVFLAACEECAEKYYLEDK